MDKKEIAEDPYMKQGGFSVRLIVLPMSMRKLCLWLGAAPGSPAMIKESAGANKANEHGDNIPTVYVSLHKKTNEVVETMMPREKDLAMEGKGGCIQCCCKYRCKAKGPKE